MSRFQCIILCLLALPIAAQAEGRPGGGDHFENDQVRTFTNATTLPGGVRAEISALALHQHGGDVQRVFQHAFADLQALASRFNTRDPNSEIARLNSRAGEEPVRVSEDTIRLLKLAKRVAQMTGGAFTIVSSDAGSMADIEINGAKQTVAFHKPDLKIDVSPVVDGFLADQLMKTIWDANIDNAMVEVGSATRSVGSNIVGPWRKTVADMASNYAGRGIAISFSNAATATVAAGAKRPFVNRRGGEVSGTDCRSATVITKDAAVADALANTIYELGPDAGIELANRLPGVRAVIRDNAGNLRKSKGL